ncbi:MAG TPA: toprim domain-containing protein [Burkholderiaceae bacterium]|nr:toprim domain-containing protein [Burkholderiaceae bacterium]
MTDSFGSFRTELLATLGGAPATIEPGRLHRFSTSERRGDSAGWCKLFDDLRGGVYGCHRQFPGESFTWSAIDRRTMTLEQRSLLARQFEAATAEREAQQRMQWSENAQRIAQMWAQCVPISPDDPCSAYLTQRGLVGAWPLPEVLRFHPSLPYWNGVEKLGPFPAMVAPLIAPDGRTVALHRTYLTAHGRKAGVPTPKKVTGASGVLAGASIPLHEPTGGVIGIAEGIETALAAWCISGVPTVAAYCAGNLAAWQCPAGVQRLVVFADADKAGREAADTLRAKALSRHLRCEVMTPTDEGSDWCDVWAASRPTSINAEVAA